MSTHKPKKNCFCCMLAVSELRGPPPPPLARARHPHGLYRAPPARPSMSHPLPPSISAALKIRSICITFSRVSLLSGIVRDIKSWTTDGLVDSVDKIKV